MYGWGAPHNGKVLTLLTIVSVLSSFNPWIILALRAVSSQFSTSRHHTRLLNWQILALAAPDQPGSDHIFYTRNYVHPFFLIVSPIRRLDRLCYFLTSDHDVGLRIIFRICFLSPNAATLVTLHDLDTYRTQLFT